MPNGLKQPYRRRLLPLEDGFVQSLVCAAHCLAGFVCVERDDALGGVGWEEIDEHICFGLNVFGVCWFIYGILQLKGFLFKFILICHKISGAKPTKPYYGLIINSAGPGA